MSAGSQFELLRQRRFAPLFWVQFLGAANDNVFKFAFTLLATYAASAWGGVDPKLPLDFGLFLGLTGSTISGTARPPVEVQGYQRS